MYANRISDRIILDFANGQQFGLPRLRLGIIFTFPQTTAGRSGENGKELMAWNLNLCRLVIGPTTSDVICLAPARPNLIAELGHRVARYLYFFDFHGE